MPTNAHGPYVMNSPYSRIVGYNMGGPSLLLHMDDSIPFSNGLRTTDATSLVDNLGTRWGVNDNTLDAYWLGLPVSSNPTAEYFGWPDRSANYPLLAMPDISNAHSKFGQSSFWGGAGNSQEAFILGNQLRWQGGSMFVEPPLTITATQPYSIDFWVYPYSAWVVDEVPPFLTEPFNRLQYSKGEAIGIITNPPYNLIQGVTPIGEWNAALFQWWGNPKAYAVASVEWNDPNLNNGWGGGFWSRPDFEFSLSGLKFGFRSYVMGAPNRYSTYQSDLNLFMDYPSASCASGTDAHRMMYLHPYAFIDSDRWEPGKDDFVLYGVDDCTPSLGYKIDVNTWHHFAITWDLITLRFFVNGQLHFTSNKNILTNNPTITAPSTYVDELRIKENKAAWVNNFTPPASPYPPRFPLV